MLVFICSSAAPDNELLDAFQSERAARLSWTKSYLTGPVTFEACVNGGATAVYHRGAYVGTISKLFAKPFSSHL